MAVIGVLLAAVVVLPMLDTFLHDARFSGSSAVRLFYPIAYYSRLPALFLTPGDEYWTCMGYAAPVLPAVLLLFRRKENRFLKGLFLLGTVMLLVPFFGWALNGFTYMANRWCWAFALLSAYILTVMWQPLMQLGRREGRFLAVCTAGWSGSCLLLKQSRTAAAFAGVCLALLFLAVVFAFRDISGFWGKKNQQSAALFLLLVSVFVNSFWLNGHGARNYASESMEATHIFQELTADETAAVQEAAAADSVSGFYRYSGRQLSLNVGILSGMSSTQYYWSLSNPFVSELLHSRQGEKSLQAGSARKARQSSGTLQQEMRTVSFPYARNGHLQFRNR